ncbi:MAG: aquaporin, partial [Actinomycetota bacterium]|nr:aquaporin [Actinomycetota bacterium]
AEKFAGLVIGFTLTMIHLVSIPIDNTSVNPARSIATAIYGGGEALAQLWVFIVFPLVGGLLAGFAHRALFERKPLPPVQAEARVG